MNIRTEPKPICPECDNIMVLRYRRSDNHPFWGCSDFPNCRGTRNIMPDGTPEEDDDDDYDRLDDDSWADGWHGAN